jgi:hypothetical protein
MYPMEDKAKILYTILLLWQIYLFIAGAGSWIRRGSHSITRGEGYTLPPALCFATRSIGERAEYASRDPGRS